ncbi:hypothetical protein K466DRAFT_605215 [Polyporus arcularius HHB13444]|uniref:Uncharacterized protein n=1 Tax=Polyporus arcularius HHB13444 TaxID=1314778 RepID=A0A5C3NST4_9APHY|nr:hypothetical protein K466DRAFT_605215 [Polyporus arcularius HHB13444]
MEGLTSSRLVEVADQDAKEFPERKSIECRGEEDELSDADDEEVDEQKMGLAPNPKPGAMFPRTPALTLLDTASLDLPIDATVDRRDCIHSALRAWSCNTQRTQRLPAAALRRPSCAIDAAPVAIRGERKSRSVARDRAYMHLRCVRRALQFSRIAQDRLQ